MIWRMLVRIGVWRHVGIVHCSIQYRRIGVSATIQYRRTMRTTIIYYYTILIGICRAIELVDSAPNMID